MSSRESTEQGQSGRRGAESSGEAESGKQPRQGSQRVEAESGDQEPKHHFEPGHRPSEQGDQSSPSPEVIAKNQQGLAGGGTGRKGSGSERSEERAQGGEPSGDHTRGGRQQAPGDRSPS